MKYLRIGLLMTLVVSLVLPVPMASANSSLGANDLSDNALSTNSPAVSSSPVVSNGAAVSPSESSASDVKSASSSVGDREASATSAPDSETSPSQTEPQSIAPTSIQSPATTEPVQSTAVSPPVPSPVALPVTTPDIAITAFLGGVRLELIELYNQSDRPLILGKVSIRLTDRNGEMQQIQYANAEGYILPGRYVSYAADDFRRLPQLPRDFQSDIVRLELLYDGVVVQTIADIPEGQGATIAVHKQRLKKVKQTGVFQKDFQLKPVAAVKFYDDDHYLPPVNTAGLVITEVLTNPRQCLIDESELDDCADFIEVMNQGAEPIDLGKYRLRFGLYGDAPSITNTFHWGRNPESGDEILLQPQEVLVIKYRDDGKALSLTADDRSIWIEDAQGLARYQTVTVKSANRESRRGSAWALFADGWNWAIPTPGKWANVRAVEVSQTPRSQRLSRDDLAPCPAGQYRHPETRRCRKIETTKTKTVTPCKEGYYRSEATGRCRSIASAAAKTLKPCPDGQFRNPATGRCKKIAAADDVLKDCPEGFERNPTTRRCRKVRTASMPVVGSATAGVKQVAGATWGWWVFGGVGLLAVGYGAWQWRWEMSQLIRKLRR